MLVSKQTRLWRLSHVSLTAMAVALSSCATTASNSDYIDYELCDTPNCGTGETIEVE